MSLVFLGKDPDSPNNGSPTVYLDTDRDSYLVQGYRVEDPERLAQMNIPGHETVVEIPRHMTQFFPEVSGDGADVR